MSLGGFDFTREELPDQKPYLMPNLVTLHLWQMAIEGPLQMYLELPRLKQIGLKGVSLIILSHDGGNRFSRGHILEFRSDTFLSRPPLKVESVTLSDMRVDENLILGLRSYPNLYSLAIRNTKMDSLFASFIENLNPETGFFPALRRIEMKTSLLEGLGTSYEEFVNYCTSRKPHIDIYGRV
jgi:hypothetical protein